MNYVSQYTQLFLYDNSVFCLHKFAVFSWKSTAFGGRHIYRRERILIWLLYHDYNRSLHKVNGKKVFMLSTTKTITRALFGSCTDCCTNFTRSVCCNVERSACDTQILLLSVTKTPVCKNIERLERWMKILLIKLTYL